MRNVHLLKRLALLWTSVRASLLAVLVFHYISDDLERLFRGSSNYRMALLKLKERENVMRDWSPGPSSEYITGEFTKFLIKAHGCSQTTLPDAHRNASSYPKSVYDALFLVSTAIPNYNNRRQMRYLYGEYVNTKPFRIKVVFLVGFTFDRVHQAGLEREDHQHGDIVQGPFIDHYNNLTYKTIMGYRWAYQNCRDIKMILKLDDDVYVDVYKFFDYFGALVPKLTRTLHCYLNFNPRVFRDGKYRVSEGEYAHSVYPDFCSGFFVVSTPDLLQELFELSWTIRFFRLEDVFTYGMMRHAMVDVQAVHLDVVTHQWHEYRECVAQYLYKCKYMAVEVQDGELQECHDQDVGFRKELDLETGFA